MISLPKEIEEGNIEYKRELLNIDEDRLNHLASQMKWRIQEGFGKAKYYLGINDDGSFYGLNKKDLNFSIKNIKLISKIINSRINKLERIELNNKFYCIIDIINNYNLEQKISRILFLGSTQSGKSTTINVLLTKQNDDGNGSARLSLFNHKHEIISGKTSSISIGYLGFKNNKIINNNCLDTNEIIKKSNNLYYLIDFPGDLKYNKTIFTKINLFSPNLIFIVINPLKINYKIIKFYLIFCNLNKIKFNVIFTNYDNNNFNKNIYNILNFFKNNKINLKEFDINYDENKYFYLNISNKTLHNINKLESIISNVKPKLNDKSNINEIQIINKFNNNELGIILSGLCTFGNIKKNDNLYIEDEGSWFNIKINNLHINQIEFNQIKKNNIFGLFFKVENRKINKPTIITSDKNKYKFIQNIKFKIQYISKKKYILKINNNISIFINNNIFQAKIVNINNDIIDISIYHPIIHNFKTFIFKINNIYGISKIINNI